MVRRIIWIALFAALVAVGSHMVEYSETMKVELVRVAGLGLLAFVLVRARGARERLRTPLDLAMLAWLGVEIVTTLFSRAPWLSVFGEQEQHEGLLTSLGVAGFYAAARLEMRDTHDSRRTLDVFFAGAAVASVWALLQAAGVVAMAAEGAQLAGGVLRPFGTLGHPNLLGVVTAAACTGTLARAITEERRRLLHATLALVFAAATSITFSRGAWLALVAGIVCAALVGLRVRTARPLPRRAWLVALAAVAVLVAAAAASGYGSVFASRIRDLLSPGGGSGRSRLEIWRAAIAAWRARPLLGHGPDTMGILSAQFQTVDYWKFAWGEIAFHAHSLVFQTLATRGLLGVLGGAAVIAAAAVAMRSAFARGGDAAALAVAGAAMAAALAVAGAFGAWGICGALMAALLLAHVVGIATANAVTPAAPPDRRDRRAPSPAPRAAASAAGVVAIVVALATAAFAVNELAGSRAIAGSLIALRDASRESPDLAQADRDRAAAFAEDATRRLPWDDHGPRVLATVLMQQAEVASDPALLGRAEMAARAAAARVPLRAADQQCVAEVMVQRMRAGEGVDRAAWEARYAAAARQWGMSPFVLAGWARARIAAGDGRGALEPARRVVALYPASGLAQLVLAEGSLAAGDTAAARAAIDAAAAADWFGDAASLARAERLSHVLADAGH